jgi:hypothetical protein
LDKLGQRVSEPRRGNARDTAAPAL